MLDLHVSLQPGADEWAHSLTATEKQVKVALVRALNKTARWMRTHIARDSAQALKVRVKDINAGLIMLKARASSPQSGVGLKPSAGVIKASQLGRAHQSSGGVRAGTRYWPHAFIASMPSGHRGVFRRRGPSRLPIGEVQLVVTGRMAKIMETLSQGPAMQRFEHIFERELRYLLQAR